MARARAARARRPARLRPEPGPVSDGRRDARGRPARLRIYLAGDYFHAQVFSAANVYAPNALALLLASDLYGSLFAKEIYNSIGSLRMHYDTSVVAESRDCDWFDLSAVP
jgi:hypothetical protein